ncbi:MAG: YadA-like family protein, partial [Neisseriaceae bacterium]|nr:YadA-like family protein [Neisseriaceae bacterium]
LVDGTGTTVSQNTDGSWVVNADAADIAFFKDDSGATPAQDGDTAKSVKVGGNLYTLGGDTYTVTGTGASIVKGKGAVKVEADTNDPTTYTVSVPVIANSKGSNADPASVHSGATNSLAIGEGAKVNRGGENNIVIGVNSNVAENGKGITIIGNNITADTNATNSVTIGTNSAVGQVNTNAIKTDDKNDNPNAAAGNSFVFRTTDDVSDTSQFAAFSVGSDTLKRQIKNVAAGQVNEGSTDAVNGDQLYSVAVAVANMGNSLAGTDNGKNVGVLGESFTVNTDGSYGAIGTITGNNVADTGADNLEEAIKLSRIKVEAGDGIKVDSKTENGATTYTVTGLTVSGDDGKGNATELTDADGNKYNLATGSGEDNWNLTVNGDDTTVTKAGNKRNLQNTDGNVEITQDKDGNIDFGLASVVNVGDNTSSGGTVPVTIDGDKNIITGLKSNYTFTAQDKAPKDAGGADDQAATLGDVRNVGWNLAINGENKDFINHNDKVNFADGKGTIVQYNPANGEMKFDVATAPNLTYNSNKKGVVEAAQQPDNFLTASQVADAINMAGWVVTSGAVKDKGTNSGASKELVTAGDEVKLIAGDGMNITQKGKEFTFNAKIVDNNGKQLKLDKNGNYVVSIVDGNGTPMTVNNDGAYVVNGGSTGTGTGGGWTAMDDGDPTNPNSQPDKVDINGGGQDVKFVGDENTTVDVVTPKNQGDPVKIGVGLNDKVNIGGTKDGTPDGTPNKGAVTIDGTPNGNNITFNADKPVTVTTDDKGNLKVGGKGGDATKIVNVAPGENRTDAVDVGQLIDTVGAANTTPAKDKDGNDINIVSTTGSDGKEYTLKTYNVNGQTEYLTNNVVEAVSKMNEQGIKFFHVNDGTQKPVKQAKNNVDSQAFGKNSIAIGVKSTAKGDNSIVIGTENTVTGNNSGAIGDPNTVSGSGSYVLGNDNIVATDNTFVLGNNVTDTAARSVFLGDSSSQATKGAGATGKVSNAKVGDITYSGFAGETSVGMVSVGNASEVRRVSGVAAGEISATSTDAINGSQLYSALSNSGVYVTGNGAAPTDANLVKLGDKAGALNFVDGKGTTARVTGNTVTFDTVPGYAEGIKAGENVYFDYEDNKDAAGNQLYVTKTGGTTTNAADPDVKKDAAGNPVKQQTTVISANLKPLQDQVQHVENNAYAGVAQAMATAGLPQTYLPGKSMLAVSGGHYKGETGYALGLSSISDSGNWVFKATASGNSRGNVGGTIGAGCVSSKAVFPIFQSHFFALFHKNKHILGYYI